MNTARLIMIMSASITVLGATIGLLLGKYLG